MVPAFFISNAIACAGGQAKVEIMKLLPGTRVKVPKSLATGGALLKDVDCVATAESWAKSIFPLPLISKADVCKSDCFGNRKTRLHVLPDKL